MLWSQLNFIKFHHFACSYINLEFEISSQSIQKFHTNQSKKTADFKNATWRRQNTELTILGYGGFMYTKIAQIYEIVNSIFTLFRPTCAYSKIRTKLNISSLHKKKLAQAIMSKVLTIDDEMVPNARFELERILCACAKKQNLGTCANPPSDAPPAGPLLTPLHGGVRRPRRWALGCHPR